MKMRQLEFVKAVAETQSFSRAAELCNATQPTLSSAVARFEQEVGGPLFRRTTRKVEPTAFGRYLLPYVAAVLDGRSELLKAAAAYRDPAQKLLRIGFSPLVDMRVLDRAVAPYRDGHPDVGLFFKECFVDDLAERLLREEIDVAVMPRAPRRSPMKRASFYRDELYYLPCDGVPTPCTSVPLRLAALPDDPVILTGGGCGLNAALATLFEEEGAALTTYPGQAISYPVIEEWVGLGIGAGILPKAKLSRADIAAIPLLLNDGRPARFTFEWIWNDKAANASHVVDFIGLIRAGPPLLPLAPDRPPLPGAGPT